MRNAARSLLAQSATLSASNCNPSMRPALAASPRHCCRCTPRLFQFWLSSSYPRHSYSSTGIVRLISPLHKRCQLSVWMPVLRKRARMQRFPPQTKQWCGRGKLHFFVKRSTLCRSLVRSADGHDPRTMLGSPCARRCGTVFLGHGCNGVRSTGCGTFRANCRRKLGQG